METLDIMREYCTLLYLTDEISTVKLCVLCSTLNFETLLANFVKYHASFSDLLISGDHGCPLCQLVVEALYAGKHKYKISCYAPRTKDYPREKQVVKKPLFVAASKNKPKKACGIGICTTPGMESRD